MYFVSKYNSKENENLNQILPYAYCPRNYSVILRAWNRKDKGCGGNEMQCFLTPVTFSERMLTNSPCKSGS